MAETFVPRPMEAEGGPQPRDPPMPGAGEQRPKGPPVQVPTEDSAFISDRTLCELMDPSNINSGVLQDIYQLREDDFEEPQELEVWYMVGHQPQREFMFIDPLHSQERPRICVSVKAVQAMHRAIAVLTRKLDNVLVTLRTCREHYWKELTLLRELLYRQEQQKDKALADEHVSAEHFAAFFNAAQYQDEVTVSLFKQRLEEATHDLDQKLQMKQAEIRKLYQRINKMEMGFDALDRVEQRDYEEQLQDLQCDFEVLREEKEAREQELVDKDLEIKEHEKTIADLREEVDLTRALVEKREAKHKQLLGLVEDEKVALEQRLNSERKEWNETKVTMKKENERLTEELNHMQMAKETAQMNSTYNKIKLIRSKKRYSAEISEEAPHETEEDPFKRAQTDGESRRSTLTSMPTHTNPFGARLSNPLENKAPSIMELLKGNVPITIDKTIEEGAESAADGSSPSSAAAAEKQAEKTRNFLEKVEERRRQTVAAREQLREEENQANAEGSAAGEVTISVNQEPATAQGAAKEERRSLVKEPKRASADLEMDEIEKLWAQVYKKPAPTVQREEPAEPEMDPDELISLIVESVASLAKQGAAARKKAATTLLVEMTLNELRAIRDALDARAYAALNGLKEPIAAGVARHKAGKHGPPLKTPSASRAGSRRGSPVHSPAPSRRGSTKRASVGKSGTQLNLNYTPSPSNRNLRPQSAGGHRKGDKGDSSRPQSRNRMMSRSPAANKKKTKKPGAGTQDDGAQAADAAEAEDDAEAEDEIVIRRQSCPTQPPPVEKTAAVPDDAGFDMNDVNDLLMSHLEGKLPERKKNSGDDGQSSSSGLSDGSFHYLDMNHRESAKSVKSINDSARGSMKKDSPDDGIPVDELLSSWGVEGPKPFTADTESTRAPQSAGSVFGGLQDAADEDSPVARRVKREQKQKELEKLRQLLADPRLGEPQKLERSLSVNKRSSEDDEEDNDWDEAAVHTGDTPPPNKVLPRAKSLPVINLKGSRLLDQLDLLPDVYAINIGDGNARRRSTKKRAALFPSSGSSSPSSPRSPGRSVDSPRLRGRLNKDVFSRAVSRRGSAGTDGQSMVQRSHSLPPCWSMPMYAESSNYPELRSMTTGLGRLLVELQDLPPQHFRVCRELMQSGWVLNHPSGFAYEAIGDPAEIEASSLDPAGQADSYLDSGTGTDVPLSAAGGSFLQAPGTLGAVPELMVRSLYTPAPAAPRNSNARVLTPAAGTAEAAPAPAGPTAAPAAGAADGDAAAGITRPILPQQWSARPGYEESMPPGVAAAGAESFASARRGAAAVAVAGRAISTVRRANALADSLAKGRLPLATPHPPAEEFGQLKVVGHGGASGKADKVAPVRRETTAQAVSTETQSDPSESETGTAAPARIGKSAIDVFASVGASWRKMSHRPTTLTIEAPTAISAGLQRKTQPGMPFGSQLAPPAEVASQQMAYDPIPAAAGFAIRRQGGAYAKAMRGHGFRVVAKQMASARNSLPTESLGLLSSGDAANLQPTSPVHLLSLQVPKVKPKPRMVSVATQTNLSVSSSRFEVIPDMDEPDAMKLRDTSRLVDKEELRLKIAKELLALCSELRDVVDIQDGQDKAPQGMGSGHIGQGLAQGLYSKNEMHFNQLGLGIAGLHRPILPKSAKGLNPTLRSRKIGQTRNLQAMQLLERGAMQKKQARPSLKHMVEADFHIEDPLNLRGQAQKEAENNALRMKQFTFQGEGNSSGGEDEQICTCGHRFASDESFCHHCGAERKIKKRVHICACGNPFAPGAVFCRKCGAMRPMDALGGVGVAHHRHDEDEHDPGGQRSSQVTFQGKEEEQGAANKHSQATMSTVASDSSLIHSHGNPTMLEALATADQVAGNAQLPAINHSEQPGDSPRKKHPSLTVQSMLTSPRPAAVVRQRPGGTSDSTNPAQLPRRRIDVNRIVNAMMEADDVGLAVTSDRADRRLVSDEVVDRSRQWLDHDRRQHGQPLTARPAGRPQTQGQQQRPRRPSETLPPVDAEDRWYPQQSQEDRLPLRALLKR